MRTVIYPRILECRSVLATAGFFTVFTAAAGRLQEAAGRFMLQSRHTTPLHGLRYQLLIQNMSMVKIHEHKARVRKRGAPGPQHQELGDLPVPNTITPRTRDTTTRAEISAPNPEHEHGKDS